MLVAMKIHTMSTGTWRNSIFPNSKLCNLDLTLERILRTKIFWNVKNLETKVKTDKNLLWSDSYHLTNFKLKRNMWSPFILKRLQLSPLIFRSERLSGGLSFDWRFGGGGFFFIFLPSLVAMLSLLFLSLCDINHIMYNNSKTKIVKTFI